MTKLMNLFTKAQIGLVVLLVTTTVGHADPTLKKIDTHRVPFGELEVTIQARMAGGNKKAFHVFLNRRNESVVKMLSGLEAGRYVLMTDKSLYLYIPSTSRPVRISPLQRLVGEANFGDIGRLRFDGGYKITGRSQTARPGGPPANVGFKTASGAVERLELKAVKRTSTYDRIHLWVTADKLLPVRADYYLVSGKHLKTAWFSRPETFEGRTTIRKMALGNPSPPHKLTVLTTNSAVQRKFGRRDFSVNGFFEIK